MYVWVDFMPIYCMMYIIGVIVLKGKFNKTNTFIAMSSIMYIYILWVIKYTVFPIPYDEMSIDIFSSGVEWKNRINLIPFMVDCKFVLQKTMLLNILLTMPFGFGINFLHNKKFNVSNILIVGLLVGLILEGIQVVISLILGFPYRYIDMTDCICNLSGCVVGFIAFLIFAKLWIVILGKLSLNNAIYKEIDCICKR